MAKKKEEKTNVMRVLEQHGIPYTPHTYPPDGPIDGVSVAGYLAGFVTFVDYFGYGVVTVLVFRLFRGRRWSWLAQLAALIFINCWLIKGLCFPLTLFGHTFEISQQGLAVLALIPIGLYNGERGPGGKAMQYIGYAFYPVHMMILALLWLYVI